MNDYVREDLIDDLAPEQVADIAAELDTDDAVAIIEDMEEDDQRAVLRALAPDDRAAIEEALSYPEESAGRLMQRELIAVPEHWSVGQVIDYLRENQDLTTDFWEVFVVDPQHRPVGTCHLSWVLRTPRGVSMADVMKREQTLIPVEMDQEEVALRFQKYGLISAAVVDPSGLRAAGQSLAAALAMVPASLVLAVPSGSIRLFLAAAVASIVYVVASIRFAVRRDDASARVLLFTSLGSLLGLLTAAVAFGRPV
jgi:hypothetical protein